MSKSDWAVLCLLSILVSACAIFGASYVVGNGWPCINLAEEIVLSLAFTPAIALFLLLLEMLAYKYLVRGIEKREFIGPIKPTWKEKVSGIIASLTPSFSIKSIVIFSLAMAVLWLPWYIANFPGGSYWDTYYQIYQVYPEHHPIAIIPWAEIYDQTLTNAWLVDHHPIFTTLVYGAFGWVSDQLTGTWMAGVALFCILQGLAHNFIFTIAVAYMRRIGCPNILNFLSYWFFALMPFVSTWALCMVKDSFFGLFYVPYFMFLFEILRTNGKVMRRPRNVVVFILCGLLLCLTKKTGIFVVVATCLIALIVLSGRAGAPGSNLRKNIVAAMKAFIGQFAVCVSIVMLIFPLLLFPALNIAPGGLQETLGPLFQQTARYIVDYGDDVSISERNAISKVLDYEKLADEYTFDFEDSVKYRFNLEATDQELLDYLKVYIAQGIRHPDSYFAAIASLAGFYVAPTAYINIRMVTVDTKLDDNRYVLWNPDELDPLRLGLDEAYTAVGETPIINLGLLIVTYALWIPVALAYIAWRNRLKSLLLFIPALVLLFFCIIAPVYDGRYVIPIFDAAPLFVCAIVILMKGSISQKIAAERP